MESDPSRRDSPGTPDRAEFLAEVVPMLERMDKALHNGDARPRHEHWSHRDPVTLFGAVTTKTGWNDIGATFEELAARFSNCTSFRYEVLAAEVSGDLGYVVGLEHTTASVGGGPVETYQLRVTTLLRREQGLWKIVHRHGSSPPDASETREQLGRLRAAGFR